MGLDCNHTGAGHLLVCLFCFVRGLQLLASFMDGKEICGYTMVSRHAWSE